MLSALIKPVRDRQVVVWTILAVLSVYLLSGVMTPISVATIITSPLGIMLLFGLVVALFVYTHPMLGIVGIFAAYELVRRSPRQIGGMSNMPMVSGTSTMMMTHTPNQDQKNMEMVSMNNAHQNSRTLEEDVVASMAPIGKSDPITFMASSFKPVSTPTIGASVF